MNPKDLITKQDLDDLKSDLVQILNERQSSDHNTSNWLKSAEVRRLLNISPGTLQNLRIKRLIPFTRMGDTFYYPLDEINQILQDNLIK